MADNTTLNTGSGGDVIATDDVTTLNGSASAGIKVQRVKVQYGDDNTARDVSYAFPLPVQVANTSRTDLRFYAVAAASGATTVETAITLTRSSGTSATTTGTSFVVGSGKRFKIVHLSVATRGNATATVQTTTFSLRINTAGAVTTTSTPIIFQARSATPATASAWDRYVATLPDNGLEILGDGTLQFGITANATFVTNAPTWDVSLIGYEY